MRKLTILGATGSIGSSTLSVAKQNADKFDVVALGAGSNVEKMLELCCEWQPKYVAMASADAANTLIGKLKEHRLNVEVFSGEEGLCHIAQLDEIDTVMAAIVGAAGLLPTMSAVKAGKRILLANKEALVMSGQLFIDAVEKYGAELLPVDSEHNAIFQCLPERNANGISSILLTGSGGPFRYTNISELESVTPEMAIAHPNWSMGPKDLVDSEHMNKGLEYIEARWCLTQVKEPN
ncbi:UNVERIFIED_CONTAM: hypothetical protein GTU68_042729 [Idotea baltica]|nr:hypothetical protein [Idotea baltica]